MSSTELVKVEPAALQEQGFTREKLELIKATVAKGSTDDEFQMFIHVCKKTGLDPFMRQIHAVKRWDSNLKREVMAIQTGIDGYRLIADRTERYAPGKETEFKYKKDGTTLLSATAFVKKLVAGQWHEISATAFFDEYAQKTREGNITKFWSEKGHIMLSKCAEAIALRKAFPAELSGVYTHEEMQQADLAPSPGPAEYTAPKPGAHTYRLEFMGKKVPDDGHVFEMGSHIYCKACEKDFNALSEAERKRFADAFTNWMKVVEAPQVIDVPPADLEAEPDWNELAELPESGPVIAPQAPPVQPKPKDDAVDYTQDSPPICPNCEGTVKMKLVPAGVSKTTGKGFGAFWSCPNNRKCKADTWQASTWHKKLAELGV